MASEVLFKPIQVMVCCPTAPSHYLNQYWFIFSEALWHSPKGTVMRSCHDICLDVSLKSTKLRKQSSLHGANESVCADYYHQYHNDDVERQCVKWDTTLHRRHNDHDGISNHQPHGCLLNRLFRHRSKKTSKLRVTGLCAGNSPGPVNSPHKGPVTRKMFPFDDVIMPPLLNFPILPNYQLVGYLLKIAYHVRCRIWTTATAVLYESD